jgi:predicted ATPase
VGPDDRVPAPRLPAFFTRFFGREDERAELHRLLADPCVRLVTLSGAGGTGKTRLVIEVARERQKIALLSEVVWFAPLADLSDSRLLPGALADSLGLERPGPADLTEQVVAHLSACSRSLLVLDNFEQLVDADGPALVRTLLERVPTLTCLVTSRKRLLIDAEREFVVGPLRPPRECARDEERGDPERLLGACACVALFVERAQQARPDFQITRRNAPAIAQLCDRLDGIPLALELAAARANVLSPAQMMAQLLEGRGDLLVSRRRDLVPRHRSLRAAIEWSWRLLSPDLQRFFAALSVFRGGWTVEAAEAVCEEPLALDCLAQLREASLLLTKENSDGSIRFALLETLREFADEQLPDEARAHLQRRHAEYYLALAEHEEPRLEGTHQQTALCVLAAEDDNLRAVFAACAAAGWTAWELRLAAALAAYWNIRSYVDEGRERLETALRRDKKERTEPTRERARALYGAALLADLQENPAAGRSYVTEALAIWRRLEDNAGIIRALRALGSMERNTGHFAAAGDYLRQALDLCRATNDNKAEAHVLYQIGSLVFNQYDLEEARLWYEQALRANEHFGDRLLEAHCTTNLGAVAFYQKRFTAAGSLLEQGRELYSTIGHTVGEAYCLWHLAEVAEAQGDLATARTLATQSLRLRHRLGQKVEILWTLELLAFIAVAQKAWEPRRSVVRGGQDAGRAPRHETNGHVSTTCRA